MARVDQRATAQADATGAATIKFARPANTEIWTVAVSVPASADTATWMVNVQGLPIATLQGANAAKDLQLYGGEQVTLTTTTAPPGAQVVGRMVGRSSNQGTEDAIPLDAPQVAVSSAVPQTPLLVSSAALPALVNLNAPYRTLILIVNPQPGNVPYRVGVLGNTSALALIDTGVVATLGPKRWVCHVDPAVDTQVVVALFAGSATPAGLWLVAELEAYDVVPDVGNISGFTAIPVSISGTVPVSGTVTANQGTSPWVVSVSGSASVTQGTSPWVVSGTVTANQGTSPWVVSVSGSASVTQGTSPWIVAPALEGTPLDEPDVVVAVTGTAIQITPSVVPTTGIIVEALQTNTGTGANTLRVGSSAVSIAVPGRGIQLSPGQPVTIPIANFDDLWINGLAGDGVCIFGV